MNPPALLQDHTRSSIENDRFWFSTCFEDLQHMSLIETTDVVATPTQKLTELFYRAVMRPVQGNRKEACTIEIKGHAVTINDRIFHGTVSLSRN